MGAREYKGTFDDQLREAGEIVKKAMPSHVKRTDLAPGFVLLWFEEHPESVTLAFRIVDGRWKLAYFSFGEIDPNAVRDRVMDQDPATEAS